MHGPQQALLAEGPFSIASLEAPGSTAKIIAAVGHFSWELQPASQTLKVGELSYVFSTPTPQLFYHVTLGAATEPEAVGVLEAVLENLTLLRQVGARLVHAAWEP